MTEFSPEHTKDAMLAAKKHFFGHGGEKELKILGKSLNYKIKSPILYENCITPQYIVSVKRKMASLKGP